MVQYHQLMLQRIADENNGNRYPGTPGFEQSVKYVKGWLEFSGYKPVIQEFDLPIYRDLSAPVLNQVTPDSVIYPPDVSNGFMTIGYSGSGNITADVQPVNLIIPMAADNPPNTCTSGCETADFTGFVPGRIALLQRGGCSFGIKAANAQAAGAAGVIIMNEGQPDRTDAVRSTLGSHNITVPVVSLNYNIGVELYNLINIGMPVSVNLKVDGTLDTLKTFNIIADTPRGDDNHTIVVGAHLDSVSNGPGINDNGSGSSAILEVACKIGLMHIEPARKVRFIFFSAEEEGLLGSEYYVSHLSSEELAKISMYLNFDMLASPNYVRYVYDDDGSDSPNPGPPGSEQIEKLFNDYFALKSLPTDPTAIGGSSDHGPFADRNIPVGGIYSGSSEIKSIEQVMKYGGTAGEHCDPNYHTPSDTEANLNYIIEEQMLKAIAYSVSTFSNTLPDMQMAKNAPKAKNEQTYRSTYKGPFAIE
jgi:Zn-dependent M28 family amino/carboxypeptidase